ncbi:NAD(P)-dependent oxidoreductase [Phenylobacterium sp.]|uniref:NAD-dependent epimerase/dehydratase family protein n=1 Tax=Phenylobacterium sp. TaxID=1871053 RepID=UPI00272FF92F|nr:NAD-dependent epimerase/dehydratase family protein [Phenylobacterium sp.]MDP2212636.1 NAD-dependent epimerase/dehydratase family protein [Phenylobacterium sp.]
MEQLRRVTPRTAFVTGGSGFVGARLIARLVADGWSVRALGRSDEALRKVAALGAEPVRGNLTDQEALAAGMRGCEVVFHVAAHFKLWGPRAVFEQINVGGTRAIVEAARATPEVRRVVMVSAAAVVMGKPEPMHAVREDEPLRFKSYAPYSASKARAERLLLDANGTRAGFETIAVRPPFIWGAGMPTLDEMAHTVAAGRFQWVGGGHQAMSTCHVDNLCHALMLAADRGRGGEAYFVSDGRDGTLRSVIAPLLATRGVDPGQRAAPFGVVWAVAGIMGFVWRTLRLKGEPPITRQMLRLIGKDFTVDIGKATSELGYGSVVRWEEGLAEMRAGAAAAAPPAAE